MAERKPDWLKVKVPEAVALARMRGLFDKFSLHTVCESALCPNRGECFEHGTATFMISGDICTRGCSFCAVRCGIPLQIDAKEPERIAGAVKELGLRYSVITSVTRDDLPDGGASHFARVVEEVRKLTTAVKIELLIPDFNGSGSALTTVTGSLPDVISHNLETVPRLYPYVRPQANYRRSLDLLKRVKRLNNNIFTKSGLMLGLGEENAEVREVMRDLQDSGCDFLTLGQYLRPEARNREVVRFVSPEEFESYREAALGMGFKGVAAAPLVRSSFMAERMFPGLDKTI